LPWPLIGSVNEASPCRVLFKRAGITDPGFGVPDYKRCPVAKSSFPAREIRVSGKSLQLRDQSGFD